ncbi:MAG: FAD-dependent thymidylate synthase [Candidatus Aminicenantes bacterium]|nr:FAD-dependent thymidylate synthase [Candidatus Aminicenantes bacterium]
MKIILAGYNVDSDVIDALKEVSPERRDVTPETLSASYARISRDPRPVDELRKAAREEVDKARRSNQTIIFKMGHHSVAEHAVFNFDLIGVSRLAIEEIERFRLASYTEKSQRYITLHGDFLVPQEVRKAGQEDIFTGMVHQQNDLYRRLYDKLRPWFFERYSELALDKKRHAVLDGWAKEDARYAVCLATLGQLGMTVNARTLELMIRRFSSRKWAELQEFNRRIYELAHGIAPSIILFTEPGKFDAETYPSLGNQVRSMEWKETYPQEPVRLVAWTADADDRLAAALLHTVSHEPYEACFKKARKMPAGQKESFIRKAFESMEFYDTVLREFEFVDLTFEVIVSATCFAQLKRHRMATLTWQPYDTNLGVTVPLSVEETGMKDDFLRIMEKTEDVYRVLKKKIEFGADYILTNAHRRRVLFKINARELYHFARLREDSTAQWDIRHMAREIGRLARKVMPLTCLLLGSKEDYPRLYKQVFGKEPHLKPPPYV